MIVGVPGRDGTDAMVEFVEQRGVATIPHVPDGSGDLWRDYGVRGQPAWVIVPADGSEPSLVFGELGEEQFANYVAS